MSEILIIGVFLASLFLCLLEFSNVNLSKKLKRCIFDIFYLILLCISTMKTFNTSFDTNNYANFFLNVEPISKFTFVWYGWEPGYVLLNSLVKTFTDNYHVLFCVNSIIVFLLYRNVILSYSNHIFLALFTYVSCFFFLNEIIIIRFGIASAIVFYNIKNLTENKILKSIFTVLIAIMFHYTAIVAIIPIILYRNHNQKNLIYIYMLLLSLLCVFFLIFSPLTIVANIATIVNDNLADIFWRVLRYKDIESGSSLKRVIIYLPYVILLIISFFNKKEIITEEKKQNMFVLILYILTSLFFMITCREVASLSRLNSIFLPSIILIGEIILSPSKKKDHLCNFYFLWILLFNTYIFMRSIFFNSGGSINLI